MRKSVSIPTVEDVRAALFTAFRRAGTELPAEALDLTLGQLRLLFAIRRSDAMTMGDVAQLFGVGAAAASGLVERIERRGFVVRTHSVGDRRVVDCHLTPAGEALLDELAGIQTQKVDRALRGLTRDELVEFARLLHRIAESSDQESQ